MFPTAKGQFQTTKGTSAVKVRGMRGSNKKKKTPSRTANPTTRHPPPFPISSTAHDAHRLLPCVRPSLSTTEGRRIPLEQRIRSRRWISDEQVRRWHHRGARCASLSARRLASASRRRRDSRVLASEEASQALRPAQLRARPHPRHGKLRARLVRAAQVNGHVGRHQGAVQG